MDADETSTPLFAARGLERRYRLGDVAIRALDGVDLEVASGELVAIAGPSGSGKTTLLNVLGCLDRPDAGTVAFDGVDVATQSDHRRTLIRRRRLGFVFQTFNLVPVLDAFENVEYPLLIDDVPRGERRERVEGLLAAVGLADRMHHRPDQLSGGQRQRVALARALVNRPAAVLADEPTGNLDSQTGRDVLDLLLELNAEMGTTFLIATHDQAVIDRVRRTVMLRDGRITSDTAGRPGTAGGDAGGSS